MKGPTCDRSKETSNRTKETRPAQSGNDQSVKIVCPVHKLFDDFDSEEGFSLFSCTCKYISSVDYIPLDSELDAIEAETPEETETEFSCEFCGDSADYDKRCLNRKCPGNRIENYNPYNDY